MLHFSEKILATLFLGIVLVVGGEWFLPWRVASLVRLLARFAGITLEAQRVWQSLPPPPTEKSGLGTANVHRTSS